MYGYPKGLYAQMLLTPEKKRGKEFKEKCLKNLGFINPVNLAS